MVCAPQLDMICARSVSTSLASNRGAVERQPQIVERLVAILRQRAQRAVDVVAVGAVRELDRLAIEPVVEGFGIELARAFVEQRSDHIGDAGLAGRILVGAARNAKSTAISGTAGSCTSQASMPPGLTTRSILVACAGARRARPARRQRREDDRRATRGG